MAHLVDTSVLARLANTADPFHAVAAQAVLELHRRGEVLHVTPQNLVEFRNMATRPRAVNGLGLSAVDAEAKAAGFEAKFTLLPETPDIYPAVEVYIDTGDKEENKRIFDGLHAKKPEIELAFAVPLSWERLDDKRGSRIRSTIKNGGLVDEDKWPLMQDTMITAMDRLAKAVKPHFAKP